MARLDDASLQERFRYLEANADDAARQAAQAMAAVVERAAKKKLGASSHPKNTPTPARPGDPPSLVTGALRRSVRMTQLSQIAHGRWEARVGGTTVYARIQELGGRAGKGHSATLPARPYLRPALLESADSARRAAVSVFRKVAGI